MYLASVQSSSAGALQVTYPSRQRYRSKVSINLRPPSVPIGSQPLRRMRLVSTENGNTRLIVLIEVVIPLWVNEP